MCYNINVFKMDIIKYERIPFKAFVVITGILLGLALLMVAVRMVIQIHSYGKLHPDDFVLLFACLTFIASQTLLYTLQIKTLYWLLEISYNATNPQALALIIGDSGAIYPRFLKVQQTDAASTSLTWTSIFAVKICFLLFFYPLITRFRKWVLAWKVIFGITILVGAFCICSSFIACPYFGPTALKCSQGRGAMKTLSMVILAVTLDIMSDLLLISIPLILLWKVKIKRQQKIFIGIFLCLSICMIIIAIVRVSGFLRNATVDPVWVLFWHQVEGAVAIITVSITAFRSLLGIKALKVRERKIRERSWFSHHQKLRARYFQKSTQDEPMSGQLPSIPAATLTGIRTFINGNEIWDKSKPMGMTHNSDEDLPRVASHMPEEVIVARLSTELDLSNKVKSTKTANFV